MCTSFVINKEKTLVGWNLDILDMVHRVRNAEDGVYIEIYDEKEGWLPLFGANAKEILWECLPAIHLMREVIPKRTDRFP